MKTAYVPVTCEYPNSVFPFLPFRPQWMAGLDLHDRGVLSALLELSWCQDPPCFLPNDAERLRQMLVDNRRHSSWDQPISPLVLWRFRLDARSGMIYFPPLLHAYRYMRRAENPTDVLHFAVV
jgi:hypothetical protein